MSVVINTNTAASFASYNLSSTSVNLQRSLNRLSSGSRINSSFDDAGGLAVSMKMSASIRRTEAVQANVGNAIAFLQTQDGVLKNADKVLSRMSELSTLAQDITKNTSDIDLYNTEFAALKDGLWNLFVSEKFNDIPLFFSNTGVNNLSVITSHDGDQEVEINQIPEIDNDLFGLIMSGFKKFEVGDRTFVATPSGASGGNLTAFNYLTASDNSTGMTVYDIETGEEFLMNTNGATDSIGSSFTPAPPNASGVYDETHSVGVRIYDLDGNTELTGNFDVVYSNNTGNTNSHTLTAITFNNLLATGFDQDNLDRHNALDYMKLSKLAIQSVATARANNGAEQSRLSFAQDMLAVNMVNLESANSRIIDVDVASESSQLARFNILQQAGTAMLAQSNMSTQSILRLLS
jgi:flagellin-like hook-associated protein FlgL